MSNYCVIVDQSTARREQTQILVAVKNLKARWWNGNPALASAVQNNPGQHVFPGGDKAAKVEFQEETGVDLARYQQVIRNDYTLELKDGQWTYNANYVWVEGDVFGEILLTAQRNLANNRPDNILTYDDELRSIDRSSIADALRVFERDDNRQNPKMRTTWFTNICNSLLKQIEATGRDVA